MKYSDKPFNFEERSRLFAKNVSSFIGKLPRNITNIEYSKQLIRSAGSICANYIEAKEALGKKDCLMHLRISKKETKESSHWLELVDTSNCEALDNERNTLRRESNELFSILCSMIGKVFKK